MSVFITIYVCNGKLLKLIIIIDWTFGNKDILELWSNIDFNITNRHEQKYLMHSMWRVKKNPSEPECGKSWLIAHDSKLVFKNIVLVFKTAITAVWSYVIKIWCWSSKSNKALVQRMQSKLLTMMTEAPLVLLTGSITIRLIGSEPFE